MSHPIQPGWILEFQTKEMRKMNNFFLVAFIDEFQIRKIETRKDILDRLCKKVKPINIISNLLVNNEINFFKIYLFFIYMTKKYNIKTNWVIIISLLNDNDSVLSGP